MIYNNFASAYDKLMAPLESLFLDRWRAETLSLLDPEATVLEIGAGTGLNFAHYPQCKQAVASEYSFQMLMRARGKTNSIPLVQADAGCLPFPDNSFDAAFATLVFCGLQNPTIGFEQLRRVVKPGGAVILLEHVRPNGLLGYIFDALNVLTVALIDDHFNRKTAQIAANAGLIVRNNSRKAFGVVNLIECENPS